MNDPTLSEEELLNKQEDFIEFAKNDVEYFKFIPAKLRNQKQFILNFIKYFDKNKEIYPATYLSGYCKEIIATSLVFNDDREIILKLTEKSSECLEFASERLRADKEIVLAAVKASSNNTPDGQRHFERYTFRFVSEELKEKLFKLSNYAEVIKFLESEILYDKLQQDLSENQVATKRIKI